MSCITATSAKVPQAPDIVYSVLYFLSVASILIGVFHLLAVERRINGFLQETSIVYILIVGEIVMYSLAAYHFIHSEELRDLLPPLPSSATHKTLKTLSEKLLRIVERFFRLLIAFAVLLAPEHTIVPLQNVTQHLYNALSAHTFSLFSSWLAWSGLAPGQRLAYIAQVQVAHHSMVFITLFVCLIVCDFISILTIHLGAYSDMTPVATYLLAPTERYTPSSTLGLAGRYVTSRRFISYACAILSSVCLFLIASASAHIVLWLPSLLLFLYFIQMQWRQRVVYAPLIVFLSRAWTYLKG